MVIDDNIQFSNDNVLLLAKQLIIISKLIIVYVGFKVLTALAYVPRKRLIRFYQTTRRHVTKSCS
jgi:hypothetical protein